MWVRTHNLNPYGQKFRISTFLGNNKKKLGMYVDLFHQLQILNIKLWPFAAGGKRPHHLRIREHRPQSAKFRPKQI